MSGSSPWGSGESGQPLWADTRTSPHGHSSISSHPSLAGQEAGGTQSLALPVVTPWLTALQGPHRPQDLNSASQGLYGHTHSPQDASLPWSCPAVSCREKPPHPAPPQPPAFLSCPGPAHISSPATESVSSEEQGCWALCRPAHPSPCPGSPRTGPSAGSTQEAVSVSPGHGDHSTRHPATSPHGGQGGHRN